jgi:hypothetical protein
MRTEVPFVQDTTGNRPAPQYINVWNLRFLAGASTSSAPAVIEAALARVRIDPADESSPQKLTGTITNRGSAPLRGMMIRVRNASVAIGGPPLLPGETVQIDHPLHSNDAMFRLAHQPANPWVPAAGESPIDGYWEMTNLSSSAERIDRLMRDRTDLACVYALAVDPTPGVTIGSPDARQKHWQVVRAVVQLNEK